MSRIANRYNVDIITEGVEEYLDAQNEERVRREALAELDRLRDALARLEESYAKFRQADLAHLCEWEVIETDEDYLCEIEEVNERIRELSRLVA